MEDKYDVFICYRGSSSKGREIGNIIYNNCYVKNKIYFTPEVKNANFLTDPQKYIPAIKHLIVVLTKDFFDDFLMDDGEPNPFSVTREEIRLAFQNKNLEFVPVQWEGFDWNSKSKIEKYTNKELLVKLYGEENANRLIGTPAIYCNYEQEEFMIKKVKEKLEDDREKTEAVFFDFDGTLTLDYFGRQAWLQIWLELGYDEDEYWDIWDKYEKEKEITHEEWCRIMEDKFQDASLTKDRFFEITSKMYKTPIPDIEETIEFLKSKGIFVFMISGYIEEGVKHIFGEKIYNLFDKVESNKMYFDDKGNLITIRGTPYDVEGKRKFVENMCKEKGIDIKRVLYVGNSYNDKFVKGSGCTSICINPKDAEESNKEYWDDYIRRCKSLKEILKWVK